MKETFRRVSCLLLVASVLFTGVLPVYASSISELQNEIDEQQKNLDKVNSSISDLEDEQDVLEEEISDLDAEVLNMMTSIGVLEDDIAEKEEEISKVQQQYDEAKAEEIEQYEAMKIRIQYMYENGNQNYISILFEAKSMSDLLNKAEYVEEIYTYDRKKLEEYQEITRQVEELRISLEAEKSTLESQKTEMEEEKNVLNGLLVQKRSQAEDYEAQIAKARKEAAAYKAKIKEDKKKIDKLKEEERKKLAKKAADSTQKNPDTSTIITDATGSALGKQIANYACQFVGNPYVSGGTSLTNGADCSGFTYRVYADFGYSIPRTSYAQRNAGVGVDYANAQPGDIVCYEGHVGLYIGGGRIVHASTPSSGIKISTATYRTIVAVRRIV